MSVNSRVASMKDGMGLAVKEEAGRIVGAFGNDPIVTLNALVFVLGLLCGNIRSEVRDQIIDGIPSNIRMNIGATEAPLQ